MGHIRGPKPRYAMIGQGSSITCSVAAPQNDSTFEMYIEGTPASQLSPYSPWYNASFTRSTYRYRNGTVPTDIEGYVDEFTADHNGALINCTSWKYNGSIATYIRLRPDNSTDNNTDWTPIFNSTSETVGPFNYPNLPEFRVKFTKHKEVDKYLYQSVNVNLYNGNGTRLGHTNFILYGEADEDYPSNTSITAYKRFYFDGPWCGNSSCSEYLNLDYLEGFNFEMQTSVGSSNMFQFTKPDGEVHSESMDHCSSFSTWQEMVQGAQSADLKLTTWTQDLADYFTTEYSVNIVSDNSTDNSTGILKELKLLLQA